MSSLFYTSTSGAQNASSLPHQAKPRASNTLPLPYTSASTSGSLSQPGSPNLDLDLDDDDVGGTLKNTSNTLGSDNVAGVGSKDHSTTGGSSSAKWTMMVLWNKYLPGSNKRRNKNKNKKTGGSDRSADGRSGGGEHNASDVLRNDFIFQAERTRSNYLHRPDSVVEEEITLRTLNRRDRNSAIIRKSLALDDDPFATALSHSPYSRHLGGQSHNRQSGDVSMTSSAATVARVTSFRESGKGHHFRFEADDPAQVLWCDICGEAIFSLLYRAIRCENCGYLCHENCRPGVGLDCPAELEKQLEQRLSQVDPEKRMSQLETPSREERAASNNGVSSVSASPQNGEPSPPFSTPPLTPNAYDSTSEHQDEISSSSVSIATDSSQDVTAGANADVEEEVATPVLRRKQERRRSQRPKFDFAVFGSGGSQDSDDVTGSSRDLGGSDVTAASLSEEQVQKWALRLMRSNSLYSKSPIMYDRSLRPGNLVGSAAGPKLMKDLQLPPNLSSSSGLSSGAGSAASTGDSCSSGSSASSFLVTAGTLPTKLKAKDLEKRVLEYARNNPQSDLKLVKKSSSGALSSAGSSAITKEVSKSNGSLFNSLKRRAADLDGGVEFEGFLHVTMCLHRPISVANEVALDFSLESVHRNMSFERSKSENRTTFYLPYGSEHAVRCSSQDPPSSVVRKLLQKFHVADDPRKYVLFHDVIHPTNDVTPPNATAANDGPPVTRRRVNENERPLYLALLYGAQNNHSKQPGTKDTPSSTEYNDVTPGSSSGSRHVFVLEENEQPDIQWDRFSEHELTMFLEILKLEEEQHIAMIREKYEKEKNKLQEKLNLVTNYISANRESPTDVAQNDVTDELEVENLDENESES